MGEELVETGIEIKLSMWLDSKRELHLDRRQVQIKD